MQGCTPHRRREGRLWQLLKAEEVRLELMGHQKSPSRLIARSTWRLEIILTALCIWGRHGSYHQSPERLGLGGSDVPPHWPSLPLTFKSPQIPPPSHLSQAPLALSIPPQCHNFGIQGWGYESG